MNPRVLVVDDDVHTVALIRASLEKGGFSVLTAPNGRIAESLLESSGFNAAVIDLMLPEGSGKDVVRLLRKSNHSRTIPILILTAKSIDSERKELADMGANDYMTKPFNPAELVRRLKALIYSQ